MEADAGSSDRFLSKESQTFIPLTSCVASTEESIGVKRLLNDCGEVSASGNLH